jgi:hypothetical protein
MPSAEGINFVGEGGEVRNFVIAKLSIGDDHRSTMHPRRT